MSSRVTGHKQDEGKNLQTQVVIDLVELENLCSAGIISSNVLEIRRQQKGSEAFKKKLQSGVGS